MSGFRRELVDGWQNLAAATIGIATGIAGYIPLSSLFFRAIEAQFGWSKTASAAAFLSLPVTAAVLPFAGRLVDRIGVRWVTSVSVCASAGAYLLLSQLSNSKAEFYAAFLMLNLLGCATGPLAYSRLVVGDFDRSRGIALAVALAGIACAAMALPPLVNHIIHAYTWRGGYVFFALLSLTGGAAASLLMRPKAVRTKGRALDGEAVHSVLVDRLFWYLGVAILLISAGTIGLVSQLQSVLVEAGLTPGTAAGLLSLLGLSVGVSRLVIGYLLDLRSPARAASLIIAVAALGALVLLNGAASSGVLALGIILIGMSAGAELDLMAFFCSRLFGLRRYGTVYGMLFAFHYVGMAIGGLSYGAIHDRTSRYDGALIFTFVALLMAALLFLLLGRAMSQPVTRQALLDQREDSHVAA